MTTIPQVIEERATESCSRQMSKEDFFGDQIRFFNQSGFDGAQLQQRINNSRCLVVGGGEVGSHTLAILADSGVGNFKVIDENTVEERFLAGSALLRAEDAGSSYAEGLKKRLEQQNQFSTIDNLTVNPLDKNELKSALKETDCALICLDSPNPALLEAFNEVALQTKTVWLRGQIYRGEGIVGPTVIPGQSACYKCYELRRNANLSNYEEVMQFESRLKEMPQIRTDSDTLRPVAALTASILALEALRILSGAALPQLVAKYIRIDFRSFDFAPHRFLRLPNCPACGYGKRRRLPQFKETP
ncbi:MAG: TOMM precursor leader peptide-binding protein [Pyrinomonadaceae bacterium]